MGTESADPWILELAKKHGMNTDVRKKVFCILMTSEVSCAGVKGVGMWGVGVWGVGVALKFEATEWPMTLGAVACRTMQMPLRGSSS